MNRLPILTRVFLLLLLALGPLGVQAQQHVIPDVQITQPSAAGEAIPDNPSASDLHACCVRPKDSQNEFQVVIMVSDQDLEERKAYYADFGKEMVPGGSMVLYKGKMGLVNADCSVTMGVDYSLPVNGISSSSQPPGLRIPLTILLIASTISCLFFLEQ